MCSSLTMEVQPVTSRFYHACQDNNISLVKHYLEIMSTEQIDQIEPNGSSALHAAAFYGHEEVVQILLKKGVCYSKKNKYNCTPLEEAKTDKIKQMIRRRMNKTRFVSDSITWTLATNDADVQVHRYFKFMELFVRPPQLDKLISYIKTNYLETDLKDIDDFHTVKEYFDMAINENDPLYLLKAYTAETGFYPKLNLHIAQLTSENLTDKYIVGRTLYVAIIARHPKLETLSYTGITYRSMIITSNDLEQYEIGTRIVTKTFSSTSKQMNVVLRFLHNNVDINDRLSVICEYEILNQRTALDIQYISLFEGEQEVLILPYSIFKIVDIKFDKNNSPQVEIKLKESLSFNQPKFSSTPIWNYNGITFANQSVVGQSPTGIFVNSNNTIYVANKENNTIVMWKEESVNPTKIIHGNFTQPSSLFVTSNGDIYIDDGFKNGRVQRWSAETNDFVAVMIVDSRCADLFVDINNTLYCSMYSHHQVVKRLLNDAVMTSNRVAAGTGSLGSDSDQFAGPVGIFVDVNLDLYVTDCSNDRVQLFRPGESNGITVAGSTSLNPTIELDCPSGIVLDAEKYLFIVDLGNYRIFGSGMNGFRCLVGCYGWGSQSNQLDGPSSLSFDRSGNMFVTDYSNHRIQKFQYIEESCGKELKRKITIEDEDEDENETLDGF
ncbi:unnamed protein product [Adineta steineri]|nr:unnamed protein product [Adineta steineri]CAF4048781.1 unnamed protein product [Adineta steineri]